MKQRAQIRVAGSLALGLLVLVIAGKSFVENRTPPGPCLAASPCAQSDDPRLKELAGQLWPSKEKRAAWRGKTFVWCCPIRQQHRLRIKLNAVMDGSEHTTVRLAAAFIDDKLKLIKR
jgi:hypothetical protein